MGGEEGKKQKHQYVKKNAKIHKVSFYKIEEIKIKEISIRVGRKLKERKQQKKENLVNSVKKI